MANSAVKFYAMSLANYEAKKATTDGIDKGGIYFVASGADGMPGRIYKGTTLFGAAIVTQTPDSANVQNPVRGDVNIGDAGAQIYDGEEWLSLSANQTQIENLIMENINKMFDGLVGYEPTKLTDAEKTAEGVVFKEGDGYYKVEGEGEEQTETKIGDKDGNALDAEGNTTPNKDASYVNADKVTTDEVNAGTVTADAITAAAINIQEEGKDDPTPIDEYVISKIGDATITSDDNSDFSVQVTTSAGKVTDVVVTAPELVDEIPEDEIDKDADGYKDTLATTAAIKEYVDGKFETVENALHFKGTISVNGTHHEAEGTEGEEGYKPEYYETPTEEQILAELAEIDNPQNGDIYVETNSGTEYIYVKGEDDSSKWEKIGDQKAVADLATKVDAITNGFSNTDVSSEDGIVEVTISQEKGNVTGVTVTAKTDAGDFDGVQGGDEAGTLATVAGVKAYVEDAISDAEGDVAEIKKSLYGDGEEPNELDTSDGVIKDATSVVDAINKTAEAIDTLNGDADTEGSVDNKVQSAIDALTGEDGVSGSDTVKVGEEDVPMATVTIKAGSDGALAPEIDINEITKIRDAKPVVAEGEEAPEAPAEGYADDAHLATELAVRKAIASAMKDMEMIWLGADDQPWEDDSDKESNDDQNS